MKKRTPMPSISDTVYCNMQEHTLVGSYSYTGPKGQHTYNSREVKYVTQWNKKPSRLFPCRLQIYDDLLSYFFFYCRQVCLPHFYVLILATADVFNLILRSFSFIGLDKVYSDAQRWIYVLMTQLTVWMKPNMHISWINCWKAYWVIHRSDLSHPPLSS